MIQIKTVDEVSAKYFDIKVNDRLKEDWELTNIAVLPAGDKVRYVASMTMDTEDTFQGED